MHDSSASAHLRGRLFCCLFLFCLLVAMTGGTLLSQSTFGSILGTAHDSSGALVSGAQVVLINSGTTASRNAITDSYGNYAFTNIDVGIYRLTIAAPGFQTESHSEIALTARESRRIDAVLKLGATTETVEVNSGNLAPTIITEVSNLAETKMGDELVDLPVAIYSRSTGSTSPI